jgi:hypothetical protein
MPVCEIPAHKIPDGHDNYRGYDDYENMFCSHFLPVKKDFIFRPLRQYLFPLKCLHAQEEENNV